MPAKIRLGNTGSNNAKEQAVCKVYGKTSMYVSIDKTTDGVTVIRK